MNKRDMTNEEKLDAIYEMTIQNHDVLKSIRRQQYLAGIMRLFYWILVLGALGGAYYYVRPFMNVFMNNSSQLENSFLQLKSQFPGSSLFDQLKGSTDKAE